MSGRVLATSFAGRDIGEQINNALGSCPAFGCTVLVPAGNFEFATPIIVTRPVVIAGAGPTATTLYFTGDGDALTVEAGQGPMYLTGGVFNLSLVGRGLPGSAGVHQVDTIGFRYDEIAVGNFGVGIWLDNEPPGFCGTCAADYDERTTIGKVSLFDDTTGIRFESRPSAAPSFGYTWIEGAHIQVPNGGVGVEVTGGAILYNSYLGVSANLGAPSVLFLVHNSSRVIDSECSGGSEAFPGPAGEDTKFVSVDSTSAFRVYGFCAEEGGVDEVQNGGSFEVGSYSPGSSGGGGVVRKEGATLRGASLDGAVLYNSRVPQTSTFAVSGTLDVRGGAIALPDELITPGGVLTVPGGSDTLVGRSSSDVLSNKVLRAPEIDSPSIGGETISAPGHPVLSLYIPGGMDRAWVAGRWTPDHADVITRVEAVARVAPKGCRTNAAVVIAQGKNGFELPIAGAVNDSGSISVPVSAGSAVEVSVSAAVCIEVSHRRSAPRLGPIGPPKRPPKPPPPRVVVERGQPPADVNVVIQYRPR